MSIFTLMEAKPSKTFLTADLIDEMTITTIPVLLGTGIPLFSKLNTMLYFNCVESIRFANGTTQSKYVRLPL